MKIISIHDHIYDRVIVAQVPTYLTDISENDEGIAEAIFDALGLSSDCVEWMMLNDSTRSVCVDNAVLNSKAVNGHYSLEDLAQDFKEDAIASLEDINA